MTQCRIWVFDLGRKDLLLRTILNLLHNLSCSKDENTVAANLSDYLTVNSSQSFPRADTVNLLSFVIECVTRFVLYIFRYNLITNSI